MKTIAEITQYEADRKAEFSTEPGKQMTYEEAQLAREKAKEAYRRQVIMRLRMEEEGGYDPYCDCIDY